MLPFQENYEGEPVSASTLQLPGNPASRRQVLALKSMLEFHILRGLRVQRTIPSHRPQGLGPLLPSPRTHMSW